MHSGQPDPFPTMKPLHWSDRRPLDEGIQLYRESISRQISTVKLLDRQKIWIDWKRTFWSGANLVWQIQLFLGENFLLHAPGKGWQTEEKGD